MESVEFFDSLAKLGSIVVIALIVGLIQILKPIITNSKWYGIMAIIFGMFFTFIISWALQGLTPLSIVLAIINGIIAGLAANGAYSDKQILNNKISVDKGEYEALKSELGQLKNKNTGG